MYASIYGSEDKPSNKACYAFMMIMAICMIIVAICMIAIASSKSISGFANLPDYGIGQRRDVIAAIPAYEELSLQQKVDVAAAGVKTSQLTGSRDVPVFFQDYDVEAVRSKNGAVSSAREGFAGKADDDLEKALAGH
jgi:hypothetical protein